MYSLQITSIYILKPAQSWNPQETDEEFRLADSRQKEPN